MLTSNLAASVNTSDVMPAQIFVMNPIFSSFVVPPVGGKT